jgi:hypothetical protein
MIVRALAADRNRNRLVSAFAAQGPAGEIRRRGFEPMIDCRMNRNRLSHSEFLRLLY